MALGAMMVAGSAAPAAAASQVDFSGYFRTYFMNDYNLNAGNNDDKLNDSYFLNRLNLDFVFRPTDELAIYWRLQAPASQYWGDPAWGNRSAAQTRFVYGEIKQDWGTINIGRFSPDFLNIGLNSLGYWPGGPDPVAYTGIDPFDFDTEADGIRYSNRWDNGFQFVAQYNRLVADRSLLAGDDNNNDLFIAEGAYFWDGGGASLALLYQRDAADGAVGEGPTAVFPVGGAVIDGVTGLPNGDWVVGAAVNPNGAIPGTDRPFTAWYINPAVMHSWGDFSFHFEGKAGWGRQKDAWENDNGGLETFKNDGLGLYLDFDYNYGPGNVNLAGWWTSGTDLDDDDRDFNHLVDMGNFYPLLVAYNGNVSGWGRYSQNAVNVANDISGGGQGAANHWAIDLSGAHAFNDDISLTYALAYLALNNTVEGASKSIGTEADLGLQIQLLDNLQFTTSVGYLFTGKAFDGYNRPLPGGGSVEMFGGPDYKAKDAYTWYNTLTFTF